LTKEKALLPLKKGGREGFQEKPFPERMMIPWWKTSGAQTEGKDPTG
jgi:hypothetical protein